jgi:PAS domain S-box-containing protein
MNSEKHKVILLVEDEAIVAMSEAMTLKKYDYEVITANRGEEAIKIVNSTQRIDLILMDINLGKGIDGPHTAEMILENRDIPIVFLSSHTEREVVEKTEGITSYGYIVKNSGETVLLTSIKMAFRLFEAKLKEKEKEEEYRLLFENASSGIFIAQDGKIKIFNPALIKITDYPADVLLSKPFTSFIHPDDIAMVVGRYERRLAGEKAETNYPFRLIHASGDIKWVEITATLTSWKDQPATLNYIIDITEHKKAELALLESEEKFSKAFQMSPHSMAISTLKEGIYHDVNNAFLSMTGFAKEEVIGFSSLDLNLWIDTGLRQELRMRYLKGLELNLIPVSLRMKSGEVRDTLYSSVKIQIGGTPYMLSIAFDISERKQAEEALRKNEEKLRAIYQAIPIPTYSWRTIDDDFLLIDFNDAARELTGGQVADMIGIKASKMYHDNPEILENFARCYKEKTSVELEMDYIFQTSGEHKYLNVKFAFVPPDMILVHTEDITERKRTEEALRESKKRLQEAQKLAHIGVWDWIADTDTVKWTEELYYIAGRDPMLPAPKYAEHSIIYTPESWQLLKTAVERAMKTGEPYQLELELVHLDGSTRNVIAIGGAKLEINGRVSGLYGVVQDITERKRAEKALRESEMRYRSLFENAPVGVFYSTADGKIIRVNAEYARIMGFSSPDEAKQVINQSSVAMSIYDQPIERAQLVNKAQAIPGSWIRTERIYRKKDGSHITANLAFRALPENSNLLEGFVEDISMRKQVEEKLRNTQQQLDGIVSNLYAGVMFVSEEGRVVLINQAYCDVFKLSETPAELRGLTSAEMINKVAHTYASPAEVKARIREIVAQGKPVKNEEFIMRDGRSSIVDYIPLLVDGQKRGRIWHHKDITKRKQMEDTLRQSEEKYRTILESIEEGYYEDDLAGNFTFVNDSMCRIHGYSLEEMIGMNYKQYTDKKTAKNLLQVFNKIYRTGEPNKSYTHEAIRKDGTRRYIEASASLKKDASGKPIGFKGIVRDVTERKQMEDEIRQSEERYRTLIEEMEEGYFEVDLAGNLAFFNDSFRKTMGYAREELMCMNYKQYTDEGTIRKVYQVYAQLHKTGKPIKAFNEEFIKKDGSIAFGEVSAYLLRDSMGVPIGFRGITRDITERKRTEEALHESEERFRKYFELGTIGMAITSPKKGWIEVNDRVCEIMGYTKEELKKKTWAEMTHPEDLEADVVLFDRLMTGVINQYSLDKRFIRKDGKIIYTNIGISCIRRIDGSVNYMTAFINDITERKRSEIELNRVFDYSLDMLCIAGFDGYFKRVSPSFEKILGWSEAELLSKSLFDFIHPDDRNATRREVKAHEVGEESIRYENRYRCKDGSYKWISWNAHPIVEEKLIIGVAHDISEHKLSDEKIKSLLAEKELLLKEVHHRIKNNMNTIYSLLSLQIGSLTEPSAISALDEAKSRVLSMAVLYDKLYRSENLREMSIKNYFMSLADEIVANFPNAKSVKIEKKIDDFVLNAKKLQPLGIIINELLTNIMKHAFTGRKNGLISIFATLTGNQVCLIIQDNGNGIPESIDFEGPTGFGLLLVRMLTKQLQGSIRIERKRGTRIILKFEK